MDLFVIAYRVELEEAIVADRAGAEAISTMAAAMCCQSRIDQKAFPSDVADKWTLVGIVWPLVVAQVGSMSELLSTSPTRDRCGIRLSVDVD